MDGKSTFVCETTNYVMKYPLPARFQGFPCETNGFKDFLQLS